MTESLLICVAGGGLGLLLSLASTHWLAANWRNLPRADSVHVDGWVFTFAAGLVVIDRDAGWSAARCLIHRQRATHSAAGVFAIDQRRRLAGATAQDDADSRNRANGHAAGVRRTAFQKLHAPANWRTSAAESIMS
jgi:hypothetical protein